MSNLAAIEHILECFIKPKYEVEESKHPYHLGPWDLIMLSSHYIQKGLLFPKPSPHSKYSIEKLLDSLKESLSLTLVHFYPLAGRLATEVYEDRHECMVFIDPSKGPGARFIYATLDTTLSDILSPTDVPLVVQSLFDHGRAVNHDGHTRPLLSVQVTELLDGVFIGVSINHVVADGTSYWQFWNTWSEIHRATTNGKVNPMISNPPIHNRWVPDGHGPVLPIPFTNPDEFISRYEAPPLKERIFHFSSESIARLKAKANEESTTNKISSFQALSALVWRSIIRANGLPHTQVTNCRLAANNRHRLDPPLPRSYFGNSINPIVTTTTTVGELLEHNLGWVAFRLNEAVANHNDKTIRDFVDGWFKSRIVFQLGALFDSNSVMMGSSPRFDMYGNEFGFGKPVAVRSGYANKYVGKVTSYPGYEGGGSVELEICLPPDSMSALESDEEFMAAVSFSGIENTN